MAQKRAEFEVSQKEKSSLEAALNQEKTRVKSQEELIKNRIKEIEEENLKLAELKSNLEGMEQRLAKRDFAVTEQTALAAIETELARLGYDAGKHEQARQQLSQLEPYERDKNRLDEAGRLINQEKEAAVNAEKAAQELRERLKAGNQQKEALANELIRLPQLSQELSAVEAEYRNLTAQRSQAQEAVGSIKAKIQRCDELELKKKEKEDQLAQASREESIYRELAESLRQDGHTGPAHRDGAAGNRNRGQPAPRPHDR